MRCQTSVLLTLLMLSTTITATMSKAAAGPPVSISGEMSAKRLKNLMMLLTLDSMSRRINSELRVGNSPTETAKAPTRLMGLARLQAIEPSFGKPNTSLPANTPLDKQP